MQSRGCVRKELVGGRITDATLQRDLKGIGPAQRQWSLALVKVGSVNVISLEVCCELYVHLGHIWQCICL